MEKLELLKPNLSESCGFLLAILLIIFGIALIRRSRRIAKWDAPAHRRWLKAQDQKRRAELPPGQN